MVFRICFQSQYIYIFFNAYVSHSDLSQKSWTLVGSADMSPLCHFFKFQTGLSEEMLWKFCSCNQSGEPIFSNLIYGLFLLLTRIVIQYVQFRLPVTVSRHQVLFNFKIESYSF